MNDFLFLLRRNRNYRYAWLGQVVSEVGTHFNNIAVATLVLKTTGSGLAVGIMLLVRAVPALLAGSSAGVALARYARRRIMIAADLARAAVALAFLVSMSRATVWTVYPLSALLMLAAPFFTTGRVSILPSITTGRELHVANSLTQTTQWATQIAGTMLAGYGVAWLGYGAAFVVNALGFLFSAATSWALRLPPGGFRTQQDTATGLRPWHEYHEGLCYIARTPLVRGIGLLTVGWAAGGGAAQLLFVLFGEQVFRRGSQGIGAMASFAGIGLLLGGLAGHAIGSRVNFAGYKRSVALAYVSHGLLFMVFSIAQGYVAALVLLAASRIGMAVTTVLNTEQLLQHTPDAYRGRVFGTMESLRWSTMIVSMAAASVAAGLVSPRVIGVVAGAFGAFAGLAWALASWRGWLPEPAEQREAIAE